MKNIFKTILMFVLISTIIGCSRESFIFEDKHEMNIQISLKELKQKDCVDDIKIEPNRNYNAFIWSCDTENGNIDGFFLNNSYEFYTFFASYDAETELLSLNAYSPIMESMFQTKDEMRRTILNEAIWAMKRIQPSINRKNKEEEHKKRFNNS